LKRNINGLALLNLEEKTVSNGSITQFPGKLARYQYEQWVFSQYFIVAFLAFIVIGLTIFLGKILFFKQSGKKIND